MDKNDYKNKIIKQLNDCEYYKKEARDMDSVTLRKIKELVTRFSGPFTPKEVDYLCNFQIKESNIYGSPKVHKNKEIQDGILVQKSEYIEIRKPSDL